MVFVFLVDRKGLDGERDLEGWVCYFNEEGFLIFLKNISYFNAQSQFSGA